MPIKYICKKCGSVIFEFTNIGQDYFGIRTPSSLVHQFKKCPHCGRNLLDYNDVVIKVRIR